MHNLELAPIVRELWEVEDESKPSFELIRKKPTTYHFDFEEF